MIKGLLILLLLAGTAAGSKLDEARARAWRIGAAGADSYQYPTNGLVAYYSMDSRSGDDSTVFDTFGGNDGTAVNAPAFGTAYGKYLEGVDLTGTSQLIEIQNDASLAVASGDFSAFAWIKMSSVNRLNGVLVHRDNTGTLYGWRLLINSDNKARHVIHGSNAAFPSTTGGSVLSAGVWYHIGMTVSGADNDRTVIYWLNGNEDRVVTGGNPGAVTDPTNKAYIGADRDGLSGSSNYAGAIDEVAIWNRALSSNEIKDMYDQQKNGRGFYTP